MNQIAIFDLDGTLIDSMPRYGAVMERIPREAGVAYPEDLVSITTPLGYHRTAVYYHDVLGMRESVADIEQRMTDYLYEEYAHHIVLKDGVFSYLTYLKERGVRLYVLTASPHIVTDVCLRHNGVYDLFDAVWSVEDFGIPKTDTALFEAVADKLSVTCGEIDFYDDNLTAITTARAAGCVTHAVRDHQDAETLSRLIETAHAYVPSYGEWMKKA